MVSDSLLYGANVSLIRKAEDIGIPYENIASQLNQLTKIDEKNTLKKQDEILSTSVLKTMNEYVDKDEHFEAYVIFKKAQNYLKDLNPTFQSPSSKYFSQLRKTQLDLAHELLKSEKEQLNNVFDDYNNFLLHFKAKGQLFIKDLTFSKIYEFGLRSGLELEKSDCGKCIIYFSHISGFEFRASKLEYDVIPRDTSKKGLRLFFKKDLQYLVPCHSGLSDQDESCVLGGGAYFMESPEKIFVDYKSQNFGKMNKELVTRCLENAGLKVETFGDDKYFLSDKLEEYIKNYILDRKGYGSLSKSASSGDSMQKNDYLTEEDIPF
jgi:hypothetical protein